MAQCAWPARGRAWPSLAGWASPLSGSCPLWLDRLLCMADQTGCGGSRRALDWGDDVADLKASRIAMRMRRTAGLVAVASISLTAGAAPPAQADLLGGLGGLLGGVVGTLVGVVSTALDTTTGLLTGADWGYSSSQTSMTSVNGTIGASKMQSLGYTGKGVGVALIDSGAVPVQGLTSGNVVNGPDLSLDNASTDLAFRDGFGHGTHMAGIIAGNDGTSTGFKGVAPGAKLLDVKVGAHDGAVDVSQVIAAIDWVVQHRADNGLNIRVLNLSFGTDSTNPYSVDPLAYAAEQAWRHGIVVVVAGGNDGKAGTTLADPAYDPSLLAVGADDPMGTVGTADDRPASFTSQGNLARHVDVIAPGKSVLSARDPGSVIDTNFPTARVGTEFFRGSGTSQAAAVTSGAVALLLQHRPWLTPDQVKSILMSSASTNSIISALPILGGRGVINVARAMKTAPPLLSLNLSVLSSGTGSLEGARGSSHLVDPLPG